MNIEITRQINLLFAIKRRRKIKRSQSIASNTWTDSSLRGKFKRGWSRVNYREGLSQYIWCFHRENTHTQERKKKREVKNCCEFSKCIYRWIVELSRTSILVPFDFYFCSLFVFLYEFRVLILVLLIYLPVLFIANQLSITILSSF